MSEKFTKTLTKVVFGIALACYIAAAYIMNRGGNAVAMLAVASAVLVIGVVIRLIWFRCPKCHRHISYKHLKDTHCPFCSCDLES